MELENAWRRLNFKAKACLWFYRGMIKYFTALSKSEGSTLLHHPPLSIFYNCGYTLKSYCMFSE